MAHPSGFSKAMRRRHPNLWNWRLHLAALFPLYAPDKPQQPVRIPATIHTGRAMAAAVCWIAIAFALLFIALAWAQP